MRTATFRLALAVALLVAPSAGAKILKYELQMNLILEASTVTPNPNLENRNNGRTRFRRDNRLRPTPSDCAPEGCSRAIVEDDGGGSPVLKKLLLWEDRTQTTDVPVLGGFIYINDGSPEGPTGEFTGTGSTESTIVWGLVTGWTLTGGHWCNASPAYICDLSDRVQQETSEPVLKSTFYDLGTWTFHSTGWTSTPFIYQTFSPGITGNFQYLFRGRVGTTGEVPAVPLVALGLLGGGVVAYGLSAIRRGRR